MAMRQPEDPPSIANHVHQCLVGFQNACVSLTQADADIKRKIPPGAIADQLGRFRLWCGNIAAHRRGKSSLDHKLREASHIRERVVDLLQNLLAVIGEAVEIITSERVPWEDLSDSDSDISENEIANDGDSETELQQLTSNMAEINTCLMRLSMAIRNPAPHDQFKESKNINTAHFETFDIDHVRGKFPDTADFLVDRLGRAISRRRQYLRYRKEHREKFEQGLQKPQEQEQEQETGPFVEISQLPPPTVSAALTPSDHFLSTVASSIPLAIKTIESGTDFDENDHYDDTMSQTSYASSTNDASRLRPPPIPEEGQDGDPFECTLCYRFTAVKNQSAWHKHIYGDLQPYVCTFQECELPDRIFESRQDWFNHEVQAHRKYWQCIDRCDLTFRSMPAFIEHVQRNHEELSIGSRSDDLMRSCERQVNMETEAECPLCQLQLPSLIQLRRHLGRHCEELALFALPSYVKDEDTDDSEADMNNKVNIESEHDLDINANSSSESGDDAEIGETGTILSGEDGNRHHHSLQLGELIVTDGAVYFNPVKLILADNPEALFGTLWVLTDSIHFVPADSALFYRFPHNEIESYECRKSPDHTIRLTGAIYEPMKLAPEAVDRQIAVLTFSAEDFPRILDLLEPKLGAKRILDSGSTETNKSLSPIPNVSSAGMPSTTPVEHSPEWYVHKLNARSISIPQLQDLINCLETQSSEWINAFVHADVHFSLVGWLRRLTNPTSEDAASRDEEDFALLSGGLRKCFDILEVKGYAIDHPEDEADDEVNYSDSNASISDPTLANKRLEYIFGEGQQLVSRRNSASSLTGDEPISQTIDINPTSASPKRVISINNVIFSGLRLEIHGNIEILDDGIRILPPASSQLYEIPFDEISDFDLSIDSTPPGIAFTANVYNVYRAASEIIVRNAACGLAFPGYGFDIVSEHFQRKCRMLKNAITDDNFVSRLAPIADAQENSYPVQDTENVPVDLDKAIQSARENVGATSEHDSLRAAHLVRLGGLLLDRYKRLKEPENLEEALQSTRTAVLATPADHPDRAARLESLSLLLSHKYISTRAMGDLDEAIELARESVIVTPADSPDRKRFLYNLSNQLATRSARTATKSDLDEAIDLALEAVVATSENDPDRVAQLLNLSAQLRKRHAIAGKLSDLNMAIKHAEEAVSFLPRESPSKETSSSLDFLASHFAAKYAQTGKIFDLLESIRLERESVAITPEHHPEKAHRLWLVGNRLYEEYTQTKSINTLDEAIQITREVTREAINSASGQFPDKCWWIARLGTQLSQRYSETGALADLDESILWTRRCFDVLQANSTQRREILYMLGNRLNARYLKTRVMVDLEQSIEAEQEALKFGRWSSEEQAQHFSILGDRLESMFSRTRELNDLDKAIQFSRECVNAVSENHPSRDKWLKSLERRLRNRALIAEAAGDLDSTIQFEEQSAEEVDSETEEERGMSDVGDSEKPLQGTPNTQPSTTLFTKTTVTKALPTVRDHTADKLDVDGDEYLPREIDEVGDKKITANVAKEVKLEDSPLNDDVNEVPRGTVDQQPILEKAENLNLDHRFVLTSDPTADDREPSIERGNLRHLNIDLESNAEIRGCCANCSAVIGSFSTNSWFRVASTNYRLPTHSYSSNLRPQGVETTVSDRGLEDYQLQRMKCPACAQTLAYKAIDVPKWGDLHLGKHFFILERLELQHSIKQDDSEEWVVVSPNIVEDIAAPDEPSTLAETKATAESGTPATQNTSRSTVIHNDLLELEGAPPLGPLSGESKQPSLPVDDRTSLYTLIDSLGNDEIRSHSALDQLTKEIEGKWTNVARSTFRVSENFIDQRFPEFSEAVVLLQEATNKSYLVRAKHLDTRHYYIFHSGLRWCFDMGPDLQRAASFFQNGTMPEIDHWAYGIDPYKPSTWDEGKDLSILASDPILFEITKQTVAKFDYKEREEWRKSGRLTAFLNATEGRQPTRDKQQGMIKTQLPKGRCTWVRNDVTGTSGACPCRKFNSDYTVIARCDCGHMAWSHMAVPSPDDTNVDQGESILTPAIETRIEGQPMDLLDRLRSFAPFNSAGGTFLVDLGRHLKPQVYQPRDTVIHEGEDGTDMYWLVRGAMRVTSRDEEDSYAELKPGAFFGEISVLMDCPRTASVVATTRSLLVCLNKEDLMKELPKYPEVEQLLRNTANERLAALQEKKQDSIASGSRNASLDTQQKVSLLNEKWGSIQESSETKTSTTLALGLDLSLESNNVLHVGNLDRRMTEDGVRQLFETTGEVHDVKIIRQKSGVNAGLVEYVNSGDAELALETINGVRIFDHNLTVNWAHDNEITAKQDRSRNWTTVYVYGLPDEAGSEILFETFGVFGALQEAKIMHHGYGHRYAEVNFQNHTDAIRALNEMDGKQLGGSTIRCSWSYGIRGVSFFQHDAEKVDESQDKEELLPVSAGPSLKFVVADHPDDFRKDNMRPKLSKTTSDVSKASASLSDSKEAPTAPTKSILRDPTKEFPEDPDPIREGVAPLKGSSKAKNTPPGARWTRIDRRLVSPEALEEAKERFEERLDHLIVLRVLSKEEIQKLADRTQSMREEQEVSDDLAYLPAREQPQIVDRGNQSSQASGRAESTLSGRYHTPMPPDSPKMRVPYGRKVDKNGATRLARESEIGNLDAVRAAYEASPDELDQPDFLGLTPLHKAASHGWTEVVEFLLSKDCRTDCNSNDQNTPLIDAVENGHLDVVKLLLKHGSVNPHQQRQEIQHAIGALYPQADEATEKEPKEAMQRASDSATNADRLGPASTPEREDSSTDFHIFIENLSNEVTTEMLFQAFAEFGPISNIELPLNATTGQTHGYGTIAFRERSDAERALSTMNEKVLGSRPIHCDWGVLNSLPLIQDQKEEKLSAVEKAVQGFPGWSVPQMQADKTTTEDAVKTINVESRRAALGTPNWDYAAGKNNERRNLVSILTQSIEASFNLTSASVLLRNNIHPSYLVRARKDGSEGYFLVSADGLWCYFIRSSLAQTVNMLQGRSAEWFEGKRRFAIQVHDLGDEGTTEQDPDQPNIPVLPSRFGGPQNLPAGLGDAHRSDSGPNLIFDAEVRPARSTVSTVDSASVDDTQIHSDGPPTPTTLSSVSRSDHEVSKNDDLLSFNKDRPQDIDYHTLPELIFVDGTGKTNADTKKMTAKRKEAMRRYLSMTREHGIDTAKAEDDQKQVRSEADQEEGRAQARAELKYAEKKRERAQEREEARRRRDEQRGRDAKAAKDRSQPLASSYNPKRSGRSRRPSMTQADIDEHKRLFAETEAQMARERQAAEAREREERAALVREQQQRSDWYDPRGGGRHNVPVPHPMSRIDPWTENPFAVAPRPGEPANPSVTRPSAATESVLTLLTCGVDGCEVQFTGSQRLHNLYRHQKEEHQNSYQCKVEGCNESFSSEELRSKHYQNRHMEISQSSV